MGRGKGLKDNIIFYLYTLERTTNDSTQEGDTILLVRLETRPSTGAYVHLGNLAFF